MRNKYLIEFLAEWIRDETLRRKVLFKERTELRNWGLETPQIDDLVSLDRARIMAALEKELKDDFGVDLDQTLKDVWGKAGGGGGGGGGFAGAAYNEGQPHLRGVEPQTISAGVESVVIVRGQGWDDSLEVLFKQAPTTVVTGKVLDLDCDVDVWQRATVKVTLPSTGQWLVVARIPGSANPESTENKQLEVA